MKVPLLDLNAQYKPIMPQLRQAIDEVLLNHQYIMGPQVKSFEQKIAAYLSVKHAVGCASGTDALVLAIKALGVGDGDEVITTPFTFFATASSIWRNNAKLVFVDIDAQTFNLDPVLIEKAITPRTRVIMPVHLFGQSCDMDAIMSIAKKHNLFVIEDNAQGIGSTWSGRTAGSYGDIGTLSFFPSKNLGAMGDAGMCLTNDDDLAAKLRQLRVHGENPKYYHKWVGLNSRLDTMQAAILSVKLDYLKDWSEGRRRNADQYNKKLNSVSQIKLPYIHSQALTIYNQFTLIAEQRDELMQHLQDNEIGCAIYYPLPLHLQECFASLGGRKGDCPVAEEMAGKVLSIPVYAELSKAQLDFVIDTIKNFYK